MKEEWKKKIWEFAKNFPAITYYIIGIFILFIVNKCDSCAESPFIAIFAAPFLPIILVCAGFGNLIINFKYQIINEITPFIIFLVIVASLDFIAYLIRSSFTKFLGQNLFVRILITTLTLTIWIVVFIKLINSLPIDT